MDEEIASIEKNDTWRLVPKPNGKKPINVKWIYKKKEKCQRKGEEIQGNVSGKRILLKA